MAEIVLIESTAFDVHYSGIEENEYDGKLTNDWSNTIQELYQTYGELNPLPDTYKLYCGEYVYTGGDLHCGYITSSQEYILYFDDNYVSSLNTIYVIGSTGATLADNDVVKLTVERAAEISKVKLGDTTYNIKDTTAREAIDSLPDPMVFKGTLGIGGTIISLPTITSTMVGYTYKVITDGTYAGITAKSGDMFVGTEISQDPWSGVWTLIPSGDDGGGTVTNVATGTGLTGGPITTSGTISVDFTSVQEKLTSGTNIKTINNESILGSGNISVAADVALFSTDDGNGTVVLSVGPSDTIDADTTNY